MPSGEDKKKCVVNSYGKLHNYDNIYIADSILPTAIGANPQGTLMAMVSKNTEEIIKKSCIYNRANGWLGLN